MESPIATIKIMDEDEEEDDELLDKPVAPPLALHNMQQPPTPRGGSNGPPSERLDYASKSQKMAFFSRDCTEVNEFISVGGQKVAMDYELLASKGVTHVINCVGDVCENYHEGKLRYLKFYLLDSAGEDILCILYDCYHFIDRARRSGGRVFIHCQQGVSRSTVVTIAYLILHLNETYENCYQMVRAKRGVCRPNVGFMCQLLAWRKRCTGTAPSSNYLYRVCSHCSRDRLRVVAKWVDKVVGISLDIRYAARTDSQKKG